VGYTGPYPFLEDSVWSKASQTHITVQIVKRHTSLNFSSGIGILCKLLLMLQFRPNHGYGQGTGRQDSLSDNGRQQHLLSENGQDRGGHPRTHSCCEPPSYITSLFNSEGYRAWTTCITQESQLHRMRGL